MRYGPYRRRAQVAVFFAMFLIPVLNLFEIYTVTGTFYAVKVGGLSFADPAVILQAVFAAGSFTIAILGAGISSVFLALVFGRIWCGWMCPYHLVADGASWLRSRFRQKCESDGPLEGTALRANSVRFGFLVLGTFAAAMIGIPLLNYVSAPGILSTEAMILVKERTVSLEIGFIAILVALELLALPRFWCRLFCPTGAFLSLFRAPFTLQVATRIKTPKGPCCKGNFCSLACPMGLAPFKEGGNLLCTNCGLCVDACGANSGPGGLRFTGFSLRGDR